MMKRLFLVAGYDPQGVIGPSFIYYISALSAYGDIITVFDCDCTEDELRKLSPYVLHAEAERHREYDFGSYKRGYQWARTSGILEGYDFCYLVNDSVFGPLYSPGPYLERMENCGKDAFAIAMNPHRKHPHLQSWFIGLARTIFTSEEFADFISVIHRMEDKNSVCTAYENGLTGLMDKCGFSYGALYRLKGKRVYNNIRDLYRHGLPFFKKSAFSRHNGALGAQVRYILQRIPPELRSAIISDSSRIYGAGYVSKFLDGNRIDMFFRYSSYLVHKIFRSR